MDLPAKAFSSTNDILFDASSSQYICEHLAKEYAGTVDILLSEKSEKIRPEKRNLFF